jgi:hypothetical protein
MSAVLNDPTPMPTYTPWPTYTPYPTPAPTSTPVPAVVGVDVPLKTEGMSLTLDQVVRSESYNYNYVDPTTGNPMIQTFTAESSQDRVLVVIFKGTGQIQNVWPWPTNPITKTASIEDNRGRLDYLWSSINDPQTGDVELIFVVDAAAVGYTLTFPDGQTIDLSPFLK